MSRLTIVVNSAWLVLLGCGLLACGGADIGEACDKTGSQDECVEGAICDTEGDNAKVCLKVCKEDSDCPKANKCTGVSGSNIKACHPE